MTKGKMPVSGGESGNAVRGSLPWGRRIRISVKFHRGIAFVIIAGVLLWGGIFAVLRLVWAQ